jgi:hypothetical protein
VILLWNSDYETLATFIVALNISSFTIQLWKLNLGAMA